MSEIHHIFPTPVYIDKIEREFTKKELSFVKKLKETAYNNAGNQRSKDSYLLDKPEFKKLKKDLMKMVFIIVISLRVMRFLIVLMCVAVTP